MNMDQKGFANNIVVVIIAVLVLAAAGGYYVFKQDFWVENAGKVSKPVIDLKTSPSAVEKNGTFLLTWSTQNAVSCEASSPTAPDLPFKINWFGPVELFGSKTYNKVPHDLLFELTCKNGAGDATFATASITVKSSEVSNETAGWKTYNGTNFEVQYSESTFALVQVTKQLPPDYKSNYAGVKLISSARVSKLDKQECSYGESGLTFVCKAEMEGGIEFIQVNASTQSLTSSLDSSLKTIVTLAGKQTVKWSIGAGDEGTDYYYIPLNSNQTLVVARLYRFDGFPQQTLFNQVLATLVIK